MTTADRYLFVESLHEGPAFTLHRARDTRDESVVVLKHLSAARATRAHVERLRREYAILRELDLPGVVKARELYAQGGALSLVLADFGGETLASYLSRQKPDLTAFLTIAAELAETLGQIHSRHVIHKDINPKNILVDQALRTQVIDFGLSTRLPRELQSLINPSVLEGTLSYISPEQTGRMNRVVDARTDLYSLGATLYVMLTGRVPFLTRDPLELIHAHIAKRPEPPSEVDPSVPEVVSDIVMKLLQKCAEDRYRSAFGLREDLLECLRRLDQSGRIEPFVLGQNDIFDRFQLPQKLYGREEEIAALTGAFGRVSQGAPELLLVSGASGTGKSAVIHELHKALSRQRGFFAAGKFEELRRDIPYSALVTALSELCQYLLAESEAGLAAWRKTLREALGTVGQVLVEVLPELELILGKQPSVIELAPAAAQNRFRYAFQRFLRALCPRGRPLVLFLDDLQWADAASLDLLGALLGDPEAGALLLIGAYRDNEVDASHPLTATIAAIEKAGCRTTRVALGPLSSEHINELLTDILARSPEETRPLSRLVWKKTHGNAFFAGQFLTTLYKTDLLTFDPGRRAFRWDLARIEEAPITDNVIDLLIGRARALRQDTQDALMLAACIGSRFDLGTLSVVFERAAPETEAALVEGVEEGFVVAVGASSYRFLHDRVQQAFYATLPESARTAAHHQIGQLLHKRAIDDNAAEDEGLFDILHHQNLAAALVTRPEERLELARLNLAAARRARASAAFEPSAAYFAAGTRFLPADAWQSHHALTYALSLGSAEAESLNGRFEAAEQTFKLLLREARSDLEKAQVYSLKATLATRRGKHIEAVDAGIAAAAHLDVTIPRRPGTPAVLLELLRAKRALRGRSTSELLSLPTLTDARVKLLFQLLRTVGASAFLTDPNLFVVFTLRRVILTLTYGNSSLAAVTYTIYAVLLKSMPGGAKQMEEFGRLALAMLERYPDKGLEGVVKFNYASLVQPWSNPIRATFPYLREAYQSGLEGGDFLYAGYAAVNLVRFAFQAGCNLEETGEEATRQLAFVKGIKHVDATGVLADCRQSILALRGLTQSTLSFDSFDAEGYDERQHVAGLRAQDNKIPLHIYWVFKMWVLYIFGHHDEALSLYHLAGEGAERVIGSQPLLIEHYHYSSLVHAALCPSTGALPRQRSLWVIRQNQRKVKKWAEHNPMGFRHKYLLVEAELARLTEDDHAAMAHYEAAIAGAREGEFLHDEATALELAGKFYLSRSLPDVGQMYLARARQAYARWGALAKVKLLDQAYPGLDQAAAAEGRSTSLSLSTTTASSSASGAVDAPSMVKASQALSGEISLEKLLSRLMQVVVESAGAERGALLVKQGSAPALSLGAEISPEGGTAIFSPPAPVARARRLSPAIAQYVARTQKSVVLRDAAREGAFVKDTYVEERQPRSVLCMPLLQQGALKGLLYLENNLTAGAFTEGRVELLKVLCAQMAISIENASLYESLEQKVIERTRELREAQARLLKLEKETTETQMAGGFAHEMRNALSGAKMLLGSATGESGETLCVDNSATLKELFLGLREDLPPEGLARAAALLRRVNSNEQRLDRILGKVDQALGRALGITNQILSYARLGHERPGDETVPLRPRVEAILEEMAADLSAHGITAVMSIAPGQALQGSALHVDEILRNVLRNALDALVEKSDAEAREIRVTLAEEPEQRVLSIADTGVGIPLENRARIFAPFFSTKPATGTGLGMGMVEKLVSLYGGTIAFESEVGRGTTFFLTFPRKAEG